MRRPSLFEPCASSPRLAVRTRGDRSHFWTESVGSAPPVYGEQWATTGGRTFRSFEPARSKLAAALARGWSEPLPAPGERWLYLGAASGTTASHVADLLGPGGRLYALERSLRPFARLVRVAERWPNLLPILGDARDPEGYAELVPLVDGVYADIAQPDQVEIVLANVRLFLRDRGGAALVALKTSSMGRERSAPGHLRRAEETLASVVRPSPAIRLDPFYRSHYLVGGRRSPPAPEPPGAGIRSPDARFAPSRAPRPSRHRPWSVRRRASPPR